MGQQRKNMMGVDPEELLRQEEEAKQQAEEAKKMAVLAKLQAKKERKLEAKKVTAAPAESAEEPAQEVTEPAKPAPAPAKVSKQGKARQRSAKYLAARQQVAAKPYNLDEAIAKAKATAYAKFDASLELHLKVRAKKGDTALRGVVDLPGGIVKAKKIAILDDKIMAQLDKGQIDFDILVAQPEQMAQLAKYARLLGPKGLMPNPKSGTVSADPAAAAASLAQGKTEYRQDDTGNIHLAVGKASWDDAQIKANIESVLAALPAAKLTSGYLCATMGPSIKLTLGK